MKQYTPLKDGYDEAYLQRIEQHVAASWPEFVAGSIRDRAMLEDWPELELKARMQRLAEALDEVLPDDFSEALSILEPVIPEFRGFLALFFPAFVELRASRDLEAHWDEAIRALALCTRSSSSELAVRPFLLARPEQMLEVMQGWTASEDEHIRRLASEGCRPRLPWAQALPEYKRDPTPLLPLLEALKDDPSEYVRRSVANNLGDISKDHPDIVLELAERWLQEAPGDRNRRRLVKHACRSQLKAGTPRCLRLFGFRDPVDVEITNLVLEPRDAALPTALEFRFHVEAHERLGLLRLEYVVHYPKASGRRSAKVFQISEFESDEAHREITRRQSFEDLSTRRHHPGAHELELRVNGVERARAPFTRT